MISFATLYGLSVWLMVPMILRQFSDDEWWVLRVVLAIAAFAVAGGGLVLGDMWSTTMEVIRIGNGHLGERRGGRIPGGHHRQSSRCRGYLLLGNQCDPHEGRRTEVSTPVNRAARTNDTLDRRPIRAYVDAPSTRVHILPHGSQPYPRSSSHTLAYAQGSTR
jgi:hypothetical protein